MWELKDALAKVKTAKNFETDNISSYFLELSFLFIENSFGFLFNTSNETGRFPDIWKVARVTPIFNDGDKTDIISAQFQYYLSSQGY